jgi:hypothetical protein
MSLYQAVHTVALVLGYLLPSNLKLSKILTGLPYCYFTYCQIFPEQSLHVFPPSFTICHFTPNVNGATITLAVKLCVFVLLLSVGYKKYRVYLSFSRVMFIPSYVKIIQLVHELERHVCARTM